MEPSSSSDCGHSCSEDLEPQHLPGFLPANNHHHHNQDHVQRPSPPRAQLKLNNNNRITTSLPIFNNCYTFVLLTCLFFLIVSSSAADDCTPNFFAQDPQDRGSKAGVIRNPIIKEASSFRLTCVLRRNQPVKWTLANREINHALQHQLGFKEYTQHLRNETITQITVANATKAHSGEYKCVPQCVQGSNEGLRVVVLVGENPIVDGKADFDETGRSVFARYGAVKSKIEIKCTAKNVKSIGWVKGDRVEGGESGGSAVIENQVQPCSGKRTKAAPEESPADFRTHRQTPCADESEKEVLNGTLRIKERKSVLRLPHLKQEDFGHYTCFSLPQESPSGLTRFTTTFLLRQNFKVFRQMDRGARSVQVIEGNKLQMFCNTTGPKSVKITWYKEDDEKNPVLLPMDAAHMKEEGIVMIEEDTKSWFEYTSAEHKHRGWYKCVASHDGNTESGRFYVRVKDKLMPLWPFIGICCEVTLLCLIIVIYEKRRNKAELEESDTDGSPDQ